MEKAIIIALLLFTAPAIAVVAQSDSTQYVYGIPVTDEDSVENIPFPDLEPIDNYRKLDRSDLPSGLVKALETNDQFKGWEKRAVYLDKNTDLYIVTIPFGDAFRVFGLDKNGKGVTYKEISVE
jgi:hypothetical protein